MIPPIYIKTVKRKEWLQIICKNRGLPNSSTKSDKVVIRFAPSIKKEDLEAFHIVLLSCLIAEIKAKNYLVQIKASGHLMAFLFADVSIREYWGENPVPHTDSPDEHRLNLWRITDVGKESYTISVGQYFQRHFPQHDVSFITTALNELYYNVFDHANAGGNAFSYIYYNEDEKRVYIAVCDFGEGVAKTLRRRFPQYNTDAIALEKAIEKGISAGTRDHNRGFGLDDICSSLAEEDSFRMLSNKGFLFINGNSKKSFNINDFDFDGTLIYFDVSTENFEIDEVLGSFSLDD